MPRADCDAIIIGAGIQGGTMAFEMARRGLRAVVLDSAEPGGANTAASFGVLHGGLRYLQRLDIGRWLRSRREQSWFLREMPELTQPLPCLMPLYRGSRRTPALFRAAFAAERLAVAVTNRQSSSLPAGSLLSAAEVLPGYPLVRDNLIGAARWHEALLFDGRAAVRKLLTHAARDAHAQCVAAKAVRLVMHRGAVTGLVARTPGGDTELRASTVVVCAGAASRALVAGFDRDYPKLSSAVLAFNLLLALPPPPSVALGVSPFPGRGRSLFLRAEGAGLLAGTWYAPWNSETVTGSGVPPALIDGALADVRACLPGLDLAARHLREVRAGLLPDCDGAGLALRERDVLLDHGRRGGPRGLWTVLGTKLTTARALSERAVARIWPHSVAGADVQPAVNIGPLQDGGKPEVNR